ncbi:heavy-metal-associated domain-containing protein [Brachyspira hyodysenteriae]|uniref:Heavy-metal-associated domain (HMA) containing protein n=4 Tax=Brachyspira hyodysenteriae TaxID=159 RepID=A0A3B6VFS4_BRAHW|nr:heavy metal-associated domain-containing protein [Brachyspira hyodysenteriae]ACN84531.1 Heavy-metal-associated domain (HMA) containing protein [Brachyspira hyodysenteriae WA1]ANN63392.1 heavy-metal-associated domain (HMA) containing protein [Brachyspira hyodysenteriae ATCC 27164]KLI17129.1 heavy-metal-associated domain (HMA) containing protein [Brachyspira hyodysenteriae]KLI19029.1 heavy-metal-associated domain (HMA) containing protein [Brachyspira hyodysenteriae]KLI20968.1 heavy-metal-asso
MESIIIVSIIIIIAIITVINYIKKIKSGNCCSSGTSSQIIEKVKVKDKNKNNYPYKQIIKIGGMNCTHCAKIIENNFNKIEDVYTKVSFDNEEAVILSKKQLDNKIFENVIKESGYRYYIKD